MRIGQTVSTPYGLVTILATDHIGTDGNVPTRCRISGIDERGETILLTRTGPLLELDPGHKKGTAA